MKSVLIWAALTGFLLAGPGFAQQDRSEEARKLKAGIESTSWSRRVESAKIISRSGLQDQALYETIAALIRAEYNLEPEKNHIEEMAWMCKALAASGDEQYRALLEEVAANTQSYKLRTYARQSAELIDQYAKRSAILNATDSWDDALSEEENRLVNMLKSDDLRLRRDAAKIIVRKANVHEKVFAVVATTLTAMFEEFSYKSAYVDTMAWLCKALAASGNTKYIEVLDRIIDNTDDLKLKRYSAEARNSLK